MVDCIPELYNECLLHTQEVTVSPPERITGPRNPGPPTRTRAKETAYGEADVQRRAFSKILA